MNESYEITNHAYDPDDENNNNNDDDDDEDDESWYTYLKTKTYSLIGLPRSSGAPMKKKKYLRRKFTLLHIKSTTPGELFERKLEAEEYGEALHLARAFNLDTDLVYQKQWRSKAITESTIIDYLSKIKKRSWILHECEERVPANIDTTKYLLEFGKKENIEKV